ncbi:hypothetical protein J1605_009435 [Eschrichtius robustus]|uniref:Uncharacterized protein n=1 Tax=Eschrichtius robustus TaxID=9764 RepID=A0AB34GV49_ESCRO|nr:hypothetical protein J1605_009435 [Eschrichtius robustus]
MPDTQEALRRDCRVNDWCRFRGRDYLLRVLFITRMFTAGLPRAKPAPAVAKPAELTETVAAHKSRAEPAGTSQVNRTGNDALDLPAKKPLLTPRRVIVVDQEPDRPTEL